MKLQCACNNFTLEWNSEVKHHIARQCACHYCRAQHAAFVSDPKSHVKIMIADDHKTNIITHGHHSAQFFECESCGIILVTSMIDSRHYCVFNAIALNLTHYQIDPNRKHYDHETVSERLLRRKTHWCLVTET